MTAQPSEGSGPHVVPGAATPARVTLAHRGAGGTRGRAEGHDGAALRREFRDRQGPGEARPSQRRPLPRLVVLRKAADETIGRAHDRRMVESLRARNLELERAAALKDEFLGLVSHELRTPVTIIAGNLALALRRELPAPARDLLADAQLEAERLSGIIENLLLVATGAGERGSNSEPVLLDAVVHDAVAWLARSTGATVRVSGDRRVVVQAEDTQVAMVLRNYLSNAAKYGGAGEIDLRVGVEDGVATVTVGDRGPGVAEGDRERIFEAFYRAEGTAHRAAGIGVGLTVCRRLAEAMGGRCFTAPRPGGGSEFHFELPLAMAGEDGEGLDAWGPTPPPS